jgi:hypothetical protein
VSAARALLLGALATLVVPAVPAEAKEPYADFYRAVGDSEAIVVGTVKAVSEDGAVALAVEKWLKGTAREQAEISLRGETGFCWANGPVGQYMKKGERFLVFVFPGGKPGRLGHYQKVNPDGSLPAGQPANMDCGPSTPKTEKNFESLIALVQSPKFVEEQTALLGDKDPLVRREVVKRIGAARAAGAYDLLHKLAAGEEKDRSTRQEAIVALGRLRDARAFDLLVKLLEDRECCSWAAEALGETGDKRAVPALLAAFERAVSGKNYDPLSTACISGLGRIGHYSEEVKAAFRRALKLPGEYPAGAARDIARAQKLDWLEGDAKAGLPTATDRRQP